MTESERFEAEASTFAEVTFCERGESGEAVGHVAVIRESVTDTIARINAKREVTS